MSAVPLGQLLPLFAAVPLLSAGLLVLAGERPRLHRAVLFAVLGLVTTGGLALGVHALDGSVLATSLGGWPGGIGIGFAADMLSALMLAGRIGPIGLAAALSVRQRNVMFTLPRERPIIG